MSNRNRKRNRNQKENQNRSGQPQQSGTRAAAARRLFDVPPPIAGVEFAPIRVCPGPDPDSEPEAAPSGTGEDAAAATRRESRANSVKHALRSRLLFPLEMLDAIDKFAMAIARQMKPTSVLEEWLVFEMARSSIQADKASDQLILNDLRVLERVQNAFDDDQAERANRLAAKLSDDPCHVQKALEHTKHGTLYLINKWSLLSEVIETNGGLDEPQRQAAFDLLGIEGVYRNGSRQVPPGTDTKGLRALVARELGRLRANLERTLNARNDSEQRMAELGIQKYRDAETRLLRSDQTRARRRFSWAMDTLQQLQKGADPATLLDPATGKPVAVGPRPSVVPDPRPAAAAPPTPPPPSPEPASPAPPPSPPPTVPPLPAGCPDEWKDMLLVAAGAIFSKEALPSDEPGPPPTA